MSLTCALEDAAVSTKQTLTSAIAVAEKRETLPARFLRRWARNSALFYAVLASDRPEFPTWGRIFNHQIARVGATTILSAIFPEDFMDGETKEAILTKEQIDCKALFHGFVPGLSLSLIFFDKNASTSMGKSLRVSLGLGLFTSAIDCCFDK